MWKLAEGGSGSGIRGGRLVVAEKLTVLECRGSSWAEVRWKSSPKRLLGLTL